VDAGSGVGATRASDVADAYAHGCPELVDLSAAPTRPIAAGWPRRAVTGCPVGEDVRP
jgi:hypothetical protein